MEVAVVATIFAVGNILFGHWEAETPKWRRLLKFGIVLAITLLFAATFGRVWAFLWIGALALAVLFIHGFWLPWRHGINGWTGEPKEKYYALRGWKYPPASPREVRGYFRDLHEVDLDGRTYCVYTEQQSGEIAYIIERSSIRDVTGGTCGDEGSPVAADVASAVIAKLEAHFHRLGIRYAIK